MYKEGVPILKLWLFDDIQIINMLWLQQYSNNFQVDKLIKLFDVW